MLLKAWIITICVWLCSIALNKTSLLQHFHNSPYEKKDVDDDDMDEDLETDPDLDIDSSGEIVYAM